MTHCILGSVGRSLACKKNASGALLRACFIHRTPCLSLTNLSLNVTFASGILLAFFSWACFC
jgi:hypothetical protein